MKTNLLNKVLTIAAGFAFFGAMSAQARVTFDWKNGKMQGWHNIKSSSAAAGYYDLAFAPVSNEHDSHAEPGEFFLGQDERHDQVAMNWRKWPIAGSGAHQTLWAESPAFKLDGSGALTYFGSGSNGPINPATGENNMSLIGFTIPDVGGTWGDASGSEPSTIGLMAVGLRDVASGEFVLSKNFDDFGFRLYAFTAEELAPYANNGRAYTLDVVDALCGTGAWCAIGRVTIPGTLLVPESSGLGALALGGLLVGLGGAALVLRKRKQAAKATGLAH